jgi:hypothetical protein
VAALASACAGAGSAGRVSPQSTPFTDHGQTQQSRHDGGPAIVVATDPAGTGLGELATSADPARLYIGVFQGEQRTGGYAVRVERVERDRARVVVRATFAAPPPGALTIQVLTSPARLISIDRQSASGVSEVVLLDQSGAERARGPVPQSRT